MAKNTKNVIFWKFLDKKRFFFLQKTSLLCTTATLYFVLALLPLISNYFSEFLNFFKKFRIFLFLTKVRPYLETVIFWVDKFKWLNINKKLKHSIIFKMQKLKKHVKNSREWALKTCPKAAALWTLIFYLNFRPVIMISSGKNKTKYFCPQSCHYSGQIVCASKCFP